MKTNKWKRTARLESPHAEFDGPLGRTRLLKVNSITKGRYDTALIAVNGPYTMGTWEIGSTYLDDIPGLREMITKEFANENLS